MDIGEEISYLKNGSSSEEILLNLMVEKEELEQKIHIFKVIKLTDSIREMLESNPFERYGITFIELTHEVFHSTNESLISFDLYDSNKQRIKDVVEPIRQIKKLFENMYNIDSSNISHNMNIESNLVELKKGADQEILNLLLSKELKTLFDYQMMQSDLDNKTDNKNQNKHKI